MMKITARVSPRTFSAAFVLLAATASAGGCSILPTVTIDDAHPATSFQPAQMIAPAPAAKIIKVPLAETTTKPLPVVYADAKKSPAALDPKKQEEAAQAKLKKANFGAVRTPTQAEFTNARQTYDYMDGEVYRIYAAPLRVTNIVLERGERLLTKPAGDTADWLFATVFYGAGADQRTVLEIKPKHEGLTTNLTLNTDRRAYDLDLITVQPPGFNYRVDWTYPEEEFKDLEAQAAQDAQHQQDTIAPKIDLDHYNGHYKREAQGEKPPSWFPSQVFDDGKKTYIEFPPNLGSIEAPALFVFDEKAQQITLVNYRPRGNFYEVDGLFDVAELRLGDDVVRISKTGAQ